MTEITTSPFEYGLVGLGLLVLLYFLIIIKPFFNVVCKKLTDKVNGSSNNKINSSSASDLYSKFNDLEEKYILLSNHRMTEIKDRLTRHDLAISKLDDTMRGIDARLIRIETRLEKKE